MWLDIFSFTYWIADEGCFGFDCFVDFVVIAYVVWFSFEFGLFWFGFCLVFGFDVSFVFWLLFTCLDTFSFSCALFVDVNLFVILDYVDVYCGTIVVGFCVLLTDEVGVWQTVFHLDFYLCCFVMFLFRCLCWVVDLYFEFMMFRMVVCDWLNVIWFVLFDFLVVVLW